MASPRSTGSILMISAPQSASSAEAAGTNVCSATSRIRTPSITALIRLLGLVAGMRASQTPYCDIDVDNDASGPAEDRTDRALRRAVAARGPRRDQAWP